ncbi:hypothetical protein [Acidianus ambivalens]|nr:hypothetical protein [Acidianus ambivalens]
MTLAYRYDNGYVATGILQECTSPVTLINVHFPTSYRYGCETFNVINTYGFTDPSGVNPSFALEGTITSVCTILFCCHDSTGWDAMWVNVAQVPINAVAGHSSAIGVGGTAPIPTFYAESGLTLFHNEFLGVWWNPYAWYFSIGFAVAYSSRNLHYVQLSECQSKNTINGLNYCTHWIQP